MINFAKIKRIIAFFGPAYIVSIGYMDPGNWATDVMSGSRYGYALVWVLLLSNIMAICLQSLCSRLGIVTGKDLAQINRAIYPKYANYALYALAELAIIATDIAEVLGMALGLNLLFGLPLIWGILLTVLDTFLFLILLRFGFKVFEIFIICFISIISGGLFFVASLTDPEPVKILGGLVPSIPDKDAILIMVGIIGATVMPHNLYLHSAIVKDKVPKNPTKPTIKRAIFWTTIDNIIALNFALFVNGAILVIAAALFYSRGYFDVDTITKAHHLLKDLLHSDLAPSLFAIALIAAGQSSTITGTLAGQVVMDGYLNLKINIVYRRFFTRLCAVIPAISVILVFGVTNVTQLLLISQVFLSLQLGFAMVPLLIVVKNRHFMGAFIISNAYALLTTVLMVVLIYLNVDMVLEEMENILAYTDNIVIETGLYALLAALTCLFIYSIYYPLRHRDSTKFKRVATSAVKL